MPRKSSDQLADDLHDVMAETLPSMVKDHVTEQVKKQVPEQVRDQVPGAQISIQIHKAIDDSIPSQVDESIRSYMSGHILHVHPAQSQIASMMFERTHVPQTTWRPSAIRLRDQEDSYNDAHLEGENNAKRQKTSEYKAYVSGESSSGQVNEEEPCLSTLEIGVAHWVEESSCKELLHKVPDYADTGLLWSLSVFIRSSVIWERHGPRVLYLEDPSKQGRKIAQLDEDGGITLVQIVSTAGSKVSTASLEIKNAAESLVYIRRSAAKRKDKGKAIMKEAEPDQKKTKLQLEKERLGYEEALRLQEQLDEEERQRIARVHEEANTFNAEEWDNIQA
ncbi:hypothetical protein Tco_1291942 [Tanacetum coccineum]